MRTAKIAGTGLYAPDRVVPNSFFDELYGEDVDSFLREHRNIVERRYAGEDQATSDLAVEAARDAMEDAGIGPDDLDLIVLSTDTPDYISPSTAAVVQNKLEAWNAGTFDVNTACAGFVTALDVGRKFVETDEQVEHVLVIGAYLMSRYIDAEAKNVASLFADGSGAAVLAPSDGEAGILTAKLESKGQYCEHMGIYTGGSAAPVVEESPLPITRNNADGRVQKLEFREKFPDDFNPDNWTRVVRELTDRLDIAPDEIDRYFFTQINIESIRETLDRLGLPREKAHNVMDRFGYTGNACVAMALADAFDHERVEEGDLILLVASGGGAAIAGMAVQL